MHRQRIGTGGGEHVQIPVRRLDHQVYVERHLRDALEGAHDRRSDGEVGDEMAIHDVDVDGVGASTLGRPDGVTKRGKVGRENRRGDPHTHRLTSREIGSPGEI